MANVIKVPALSVESKQEGFRRTDRAWSKTATIVKLSELSDEEIKAIKEEPMLVVTEIEVDEEVAESLPGVGAQTSIAPTDDVERIAAIMAAIGQLDPDGAVWMAGGRPRADAIAAVTGWPVSAADRDTAWSQINPVA